MSICTKRAIARGRHMAPKSRRSICAFQWAYEAGAIMNMSMCPRCARPGRVISKVKSAGEFWACHHCRRVTDSGDHNLTWSSEAQWEYLHDTASTSVAAHKLDPVPAPPWVVTAQDQMVNRVVAMPVAATTLPASSPVRPKELSPALVKVFYANRITEPLNMMDNEARRDTLVPFGFNPDVHKSYAVFVHNLDTEKLNELAAVLDVA
jgi:hypothetical protein